MLLSAHRINLLQNYNYNKLCLGNSITYCSFFYTVTFRNQVLLFPVTIRTKLSLNTIAFRYVTDLPLTFVLSPAGRGQGEGGGFPGCNNNYFVRINSWCDGSLIVNHILFKREKIFSQPTVDASKRGAECAEKGKNIPD